MSAPEVLGCDLAPEPGEYAFPCGAPGCGCPGIRVELVRVDVHAGLWWPAEGPGPAPAVSMSAVYRTPDGHESAMPLGQWRREVRRRLPSEARPLLLQPGAVLA